MIYMSSDVLKQQKLRLRVDIREQIIIVETSTGIYCLERLSNCWQISGQT